MNKLKPLYKHFCWGILFLCLFVTGCVQSPPEPQGKQVIKILYSSIPDFKRDVGGFLAQQFTNVQFEIIEYNSKLGEGTWNNMKWVPQSGKPWDDASYVELVRKINPDILFFPSSIYPSLIDNNQLKDLTTVIRKEEFSDINPDVLNHVKEMGSGTVYALPDSIAAQALFYNKELFNKSGVTAPQNNMTWSEVLDIARLLTSSTRNGLFISYQGPDDLMLQVGKTEGLLWYDAVHKQPLFNSAAWKNVIEKVVSAYQTGAVRLEGGNASELFKSGKVAMVLSPYTLVDELAGSQLDWGVVTEPVYSSDRRSSPSASYPLMSGVNENSTHTKLSTQVWTTLNGKAIERAKWHASLMKFAIPIRTSFIRDDDNRNLAAFYSLTPLIEDDHSEDDLIIYNKSSYEIYTAFLQTIKKEISIDSFISKLQELIFNAARS